MKKFIKIIFITMLFTVLIYFPKSIYATDATTLRELREELAQLKAKKAENDKNKNLTQSEINQANNEISKSQNEIVVNQGKIEQAKKDIENLNIEIKNTEESIKKTLKAYQMSNGENVYLEYVFAAKSYEELVYRYAIVGQIIDYNDEQIDEYNRLIKKNEDLQIELAEREKELNKNIENLNSKVDLLGDKLSKYDDVNVTAEQEIKSVQELINSYVNMGCGEDQRLSDCATVVGDINFKKPLVKGTITSYYGYRTHPVTGVKNKFHSGVDIGGNNEGTSVYATANGVVGKIITYSSCGGNQVYIHHTINGKKYTSGYMHLLSINVSVGQQVTSSTIVGKVGGGSTSSSRGGYDTCTTGAHLHFMIADGWYGTKCQGDCYTSFATFNAKTKDPKTILGLPDKGKYFYSR